ncbi:uncharacterized protein LOC125033584 [Penaeus chinensis]|uniref:uncharacterized protein LOC125033584 n=1 Tax=Penaeus chinensis TaxID=139456 RepID=UPI001FB7FEBB|nr:uncharacterized protein LOC125033584 [Penaeus chinensis]
MVIVTKLGTLVNPAILEVPPSNADENVVNFLGHSTHIAIPCPVMWIGVIIPGVKILILLGPSKVPEKEAVLTVLGSAIGTDKHFIASSITARYHIEVTQNNTNVSPEAIICQGCEFGVKDLLNIEFANICRSLSSNKRHEAKSMLQSQCHNMLLNWCSLN